MDGNCTVTLVLLAPLSKGEMLSVFFILCFFVSGPVSFAVFVVLLFLGSLFVKIFGSELLFLGGCVGLVFFLVGFCYCLGFIFWRFAPETVWKNSIDVRSGSFWGRSLFLRFFADVVLFLFVFLLRDKIQVVTGHPRTRTCFSGSFSFLCPAAFVCSARFGRASRFLAFFRGAILGPGRFWDSPWTF